MTSTETGARTDLFSAAPIGPGLRSFTLVDSYGSFCETDGDGTGSVLTGSGTASLSGNTLHTTIESYVCANGTRGVFEPPRQGSATLTDEGLDDGYYVAVRVGT